jgi:hypothetical protein
MLQRNIKRDAKPGIPSFRPRSAYGKDRLHQIGAFVHCNIFRPVRVHIYKSIVAEVLTPPDPKWSDGCAFETGSPLN